MIQGPMRALPEDFDAIAGLLNECFPGERDAGGIVERNPHCFVRQPREIRNHLIIKDGSRIVSHVQYVAQTLLVEGNAMRIAGVAAVATSPEYRNRGLMSRLLDHCIGLMQEEGYAFSYLDGGRRYKRFGWETTGRHRRFSVSAQSLSAVQVPADCRVRPFRETAGDVAAIIALHECEALRVKRTRKLYEMLLCRKGVEVWLAVRDDHISAYAVMRPSYEGKEPEISEFGGCADGLQAILAHLAENAGYEALKVYSPFAHPLNSRLFSLAEGHDLSWTWMIKILDLEATLKGFAGQIVRRYRERDISGGRCFGLEIAGTDRPVRVQVSANEFLVAEGSADATMLRLPEREMVSFLFGPGPPGAVTNLPRDTRFLFGPGPAGAATKLPRDARFLDTLLPLDFYIWRSDGV